MQNDPFLTRGIRRSINSRLPLAGIHTGKDCSDMNDASKFRDTSRDGTDICIYRTNGAPPYIVHGAYLKKDGWYSITWRENGRVFVRLPHDLDLMPDNRFPSTSEFAPKTPYQYQPTPITPVTIHPTTNRSWCASKSDRDPRFADGKWLGVVIIAVPLAWAMIWWALT